MRDDSLRVPPAVDPDPRWRRHAECARPEHAAVAFFPAGDRNWRADEAIAVCQRCPVLPQCAEYAENNSIINGVWAGSNRATTRPTMRDTLPTS